MNTQNQSHRVVIVGAGFGGLRAAHALAHAPVQVTLIDRNNYHLFQPLLYQVATAGITPEEIAYPVRTIFRRQPNLHFRLAEVQEVDVAGRQLLTSGGAVPYDTLILAAGGETNTFGLDDVAHNSFGMKRLEDATAIRNHLLRQFELANQEDDPQRRRAHLTFVIVGGGPTGVETAGAISELVEMILAHDSPGVTREEIRVVLLEATDRLIPVLPAELSRWAVRALAHKGVQVRFGEQVTGYDGAAVHFKAGEELPTFTLIWAAGVRAVPLAGKLNSPTGSLGRVKVEPTLQLPGHPEIYVIGDAAALDGPDGKPLPMLAPVAMQQANTAVDNLLRARQGLPPRSFVYHDPGTLATIGRSQAVARLWGINFHGFLAWSVWLVVHITQLIGFRNRLLVLINWAWDYVFYDRAVRLILNDPPAVVEREFQPSPSD